MARSSGILNLALPVIALFVGLPLTAGATDHPRILAVSPKSSVTTPGAKVAVFGSGFSPSAIVYFDGLESRSTKYVSSSQLEVETPYLRPGTHLLQIAGDGISERSNVEFSAIASEVDVEIDRAIEIAGQGKTDEGVSVLEHIGETHTDFQVRAAAYYAESQIFFDQGDFVHWRRAAALIYFDSPKAGSAVQTFWRYRLAMAYSTYLVDPEPNAGFDLKFADQLVQFDVTQSPEPRFYRSLLNARSGNLEKAKVDSEFVSKAWPDRPSAAALAAYIATLGGDTGPLHAIVSGPAITDAASLGLLGEALFFSGDSASANKFWAQATESNPSEATMALLAAKKHLENGQRAVAKVLFAECSAMAPNSREGQEAHDALSQLKD